MPGRSAQVRGRWSWSSGVPVAALAVLLAACGGQATEPPGDTPSDGFAGFPACEGLPMVAADPALYRDEPVYGNATDLVDEVSGWAGAQPGFEQLWLDRERNGWVTVGFHGEGVDVAALQDEAAERFPDAGVVVVEVPYGLAELQAVSDLAYAVLEQQGVRPDVGSSLDVPRGVVALYGVEATAEAEAALEELAGEPLCVDAFAPAERVSEGEQPTEGDGWRLLGHAPGAGEAYRTGVATTDAQLADLWRQAGLPGTVPEVDWQREVAVWFGAVFGSSCPIRMDDVVVTGDLVHGAFVVPGAGPMHACTEDANPHAFVVALERSRLPAGPFAVQLGASDPPGGAPEERTVVDVDLSAPGAVAADGEIGGDPTLPAPPPVVTDGHPTMPENGARYVWREVTDCAGVVIGPFDGDLWRLADGEAEWVETDGQEVALHPIDDDTIVVSSPQMDYAFVRAAADVCRG